MMVDLTLNVIKTNAKLKIKLKKKNPEGESIQKTKYYCKMFLWKLFIILFFNRLALQ